MQRHVGAGGDHNCNRMPATRRSSKAEKRVLSSSSEEESFESESESSSFEEVDDRPAFDVSTGYTVKEWASLTVAECEAAILAVHPIPDHISHVSKKLWCRWSRDRRLEFESKFGKLEEKIDATQVGQTRRYRDEDDQWLRDERQRRRRRLEHRTGFLGYLDENEDLHDLTPSYVRREIEHRHVKQSVIKKVVQGKFVELNSLLRQKELPEHTEFALNDELEIRTRSARKRKIHSFSTWIEAFCVLLSIHIAYIPERAMELILYLNRVVNHCSLYEWRAIQAWDREMRIWTSKGEHSLLEVYNSADSRYLAPSTLPMSSRCQRCHRKKHSSMEECEERSASDSLDMKSSKKRVEWKKFHDGKPICRAWNAKTCSAKSCSRLHVCGICLSTDHPAFDHKS